jgi:hypothetical protein
MIFKETVTTSCELYDKKGEREVIPVTGHGDP